MSFIYYIILIAALGFLFFYGYDNYKSSRRKQIKIYRDSGCEYPYYFVPQKSVNWFDFSGLINTFKRVSLSEDILSIIDKREVQTAFGKDTGDELLSNPYNRKKDEFWFDFIADTGDGFNSTTSVFYHLTRDRYEYLCNDEKIELERGYALVIGGDLVYPAGSEESYIDRFKGPMRFVDPSRNTSGPILVATPGNHDWYDGLTAFFRLMCQQDRIGFFKTVQNRSYFAYKLRDNVHLFGIDNQLLGDIDIPQMDFFQKYVEKISVSNVKNRIILLIAEPYWYHYEPKDHHKRRQRIDSLEYIIRNLKGRAAKLNNNSEIIFDVVVTGDIHHYAHYELDTQLPNRESMDAKHLITSGGGGAFGHLTDFLNQSIKIPILKDSNPHFVNYFLKAQYPSKEDSKKRIYHNLLFFINNYKFTALMMIIALMLTYIFNHSGDLAIRIIMVLLFPALQVFITNKVAVPELSTKEKSLNLFLYVVIFLFSLNLQLFSFLYIPKLFSSQTPPYLNIIKFLTDSSCLNNNFPHFMKFLDGIAPYLTINAVQLCQWFFSGILQSILFGLHIFFSYKYFKVYTTEASSSKVNEGKKNFLKFRVTDEEIEIFVVAIEKEYDWLSLFKIKQPEIIQKEMMNTSPEVFLKNNFQSFKKENVRIIDKILIKL